MNGKVRKTFQFCIFLLCIFAAAVILLFAGRVMDGLSEHKSSQSATDMLTEMNKVYIDNEPYLPTENVKNYLLIGVDAFGKADDGGVAEVDFLAVISVDDAQKQYTVMLINRDSMADVSVYGATGEEVGTRFEQISLSHTYGNPLWVTSTQKCKNTADVVSELLYGLDFEGYLSFTMDAFVNLVNSVGGVPVTIDEDLTQIDSRLIEGKKVNMEGRLALSYVRNMVGADTDANLSRMKRQEIFLESLMDKLSTTDSEDELVASSYAALIPYIVSDTGVEIFDKLSECLSSYSMSETVYLPGKVREGDGKTEYYLDKNGKKELAVALFYDKVVK